VIPKNVIFDLGGVLFDINYQEPGKRFQALGMQGLKDLFFNPDANNPFHAYERGHISSEEFAAHLLRFAPRHVGIAEIQAAWNSILTELPLPRIQMLGKLKQNHRLFLFSNINDWHLQAYRQQLPVPYSEFESHFEAVYYSCEIGHRKPDPQGFHHILHQNNLRPEETVFIDDLKENAEGASRAGIQGWHLDLNAGASVESLLRDKGLLP
jgi:putative hydrolase of the HAD superfamily